jgi:DNA modification methylase
MLGKYELNKIYNEDSYKAIKDIPDNSIDCIYVDVPYLLKPGGKGKCDLAIRTERRKKELEKLDIRAGFKTKEFLIDAIRTMKLLNIFIWCSQLQIKEIMNVMYELKPKATFDLLTWNKTNPPPMTNNSWLSDIEYCLHYKEGGSTMNQGYHLKSKYDITPLNKKDKDLFKHPTIKPLGIVKRHLQHTTQENDIVADFFMGSGTTAVACKELNRNYIGFEIDKGFHKIAVDRVNGITASGQTSIFTDFEKL